MKVEQELNHMKMRKSNKLPTFFRVGRLRKWVGGRFLNATKTFHVHLFCFTEFSAVVALSDRATLFLNFEQGTIGVFTS